MNALLYAINEINSKIPREILQEALCMGEQPSTVNLTSIDDKILRKILKKRVLIDANIVGGIETTIPLNNIAPSFYEYHYTIYQIPPELTNNKEIISALSMAVMPANGYFGNIGGYGAGSLPNNYSVGGLQSFNPVMSVADRIGNAAASMGTLSNAHIEIVSYNTLLIYAHFRTLTSFGVRVILENDSNLNNIQPRSYKNLSKLCVLGAKMYIYNKMIVALNSGFLSGGQELGVFKSIIESYSSAEEDYETFLREIWAPTAFMNDTTRYNKYLGSMISPDL